MFFLFLFLFLYSSLVFAIWTLLWTCISENNNNKVMSLHIWKLKNCFVHATESRLLGFYLKTNFLKTMEKFFEPFSFAYSFDSCVVCVCVCMIKFSMTFLQEIDTMELLNLGSISINQYQTKYRKLLIFIAKYSRSFIFCCINFVFAIGMRNNSLVTNYNSVILFSFRYYLHSFTAWRGKWH